MLIMLDWVLFLLALNEPVFVARSSDINNNGYMMVESNSDECFLLVGAFTSTMCVCESETGRNTYLAF